MLFWDKVQSSIKKNMATSAYQLGVATQHVSVTPSDTVNIATPVRRLYVGTGGDVNIADMQGNSLIYKNVASGAVIDLHISRVNATDTDASDLIGLV